MIKVRGPDRIEPRRGLVEEHNLGVERKGPCKPGALAHAAGQLGREFMRGARRKTDHRELKEGEIVHHRLRQLEMLAHRHLDVLKHRERRKQSPVLEQDAPALLDIESILRQKRLGVMPKQRDVAGLGLIRPVITRISTDLPWPEPPTMARISPR